MPHIRSQSTVDSALRCSDDGVPDAANAALHGVAVKTIRRWRPPAGERKWYDYPRWQFVNRSMDIRELRCWALDLVGIRWRQSNTFCISVSRQEAVAALDELIGLKQ